jgi:hypothetical protein
MEKRVEVSPSQASKLWDACARAGYTGTIGDPALSGETPYEERPFFSHKCRLMAVRGGECNERRARVT